MRAGTSRFILLWVLVLAITLVSATAVPQPPVLFDLTAGRSVTGADAIVAPAAVALGRFENCNDLSCG